MREEDGRRKKRMEERGWKEGGMDLSKRWNRREKEGR
jgi:hypothetical protein